MFSVRASSVAGLSDASASAFVDVPPSVDLLPPAPPGNFTAELTPNNEALLQWTPPTPAAERAPVTGYVVYVESPGSRLLQLDETEALSYLHSALLQGVSYVYHVRAQSGSGLSQPSASASVHVAIGSLVRLVAPHVTVRADEGADRAVISWVHRAQSPDAGVPTAVSEFSLQYCVVDIDVQTSDHCSGGWQVFTHMSLNTPAARQVVDTAIDCDSMDGTGARMYRMRAVAGNDSLSSRYSEPTPPVCPSESYSPPRRVTAVFAAADTDPPMGTQRVNICWAIPADNENPVTGYELQIAPDADIPSTEDGWLTVDARIPIGDPTLPVCILYSGVVANQVYWFRVRAYNRAGHGNWSAPYQYRHGRGIRTYLGQARQRSEPERIHRLRRQGARGHRCGARIRSDARPRTVRAGDGRLRDRGRTATAGEDYDAASGTLELAAGETSKTIEVTVHADTEDEGEETLTLSLSNAVGARIEDGEATGTIQDRDPLPQAWLARFGRTVAGQVVDAVGTRLESEPSPHARVGGMSIGSSSASETRRTLSRRAAAEPASNRVGPSRGHPQPLATGAHVRKLVPSRLGRRRTGLLGVGPLRDRGLRSRRARHAAGRRHHHRIPGSGRHGRPLAHGRGGLAQRSGRLVRSGARSGVGAQSQRRREHPVGRVPLRAPDVERAGVALGPRRRRARDPHCLRRRPGTGRDRHRHEHGRARERGARCSRLRRREVSNSRSGRTRSGCG